MGKGGGHRHGSVHVYDVQRTVHVSGRQVRRVAVRGTTTTSMLSGQTRKSVPMFAALVECIASLQVADSVVARTRSPQTRCGNRLGRPAGTESR